MAAIPWYKGPRGEWYVVAQVVLIALVFIGPHGSAGLHFPPTKFGTGLGILLILTGAILLLSSIPKHGKNITPAPYPTKNATLIQTGTYGIVRHPMYSGGFLMALGYTLVVHNWLTLVYTVILLVFIDIKSRREERWLVEKFPDYPLYQKRVRKLIPFVY